MPPEYPNAKLILHGIHHSDRTVVSDSFRQVDTRICDFVLKEMHAFNALSVGAFVTIDNAEQVEGRDGSVTQDASTKFHSYRIG